MLRIYLNFLNTSQNWFIFIKKFNKFLSCHFITKIKNQLIVCKPVRYAVHQPIRYLVRCVSKYMNLHYALRHACLHVRFVRVDVAQNKKGNLNRVSMLWLTLPYIMARTSICHGSYFHTSWLIDFIRATA